MVIVILSIAVYILLLFAITQPFKMVSIKYYQSKILSLVLLSFFAFLLAHYMSYPKAFYSILLLFLILSLYSIYKQGIFIDRNVESIYLVVFAYFLLLRWFNPDIYGAEKFMDMAFINAVLHSKYLPPFDPFLSGYRINCYYYFGHVIGASITLMSFTPPYYGYNIAIAAIAAFASSTLYGFLKDLGIGKYAIHGVIFTLFTGDLYGFYELLKDVFMHKLPGYLYYWNATRVIKGTINEFPYFSFMHADFHAHVVAIPLFILFVSLVYSMLEIQEKPGDMSFAFTSLFLVILSAVVYLTNSWDSPILLLILFLAFMLCLFNKFKFKSALLFVVLIFSTFTTFIASFTIHSASANVLIVKEKSSLVQFLLYFSIPIAFAYFYMRKLWKVILFCVILSLIIAILVKTPIISVLLPLFVTSAYSIVENRNKVSRDNGDNKNNKENKGGVNNTIRQSIGYIESLLLVACLFTLVPEFVAVNCRMNTVFKFYDVTWILFSIAGSFALKDCIENLKNMKAKTKVAKINVQVILSVFLIFLFISSFSYPVVATSEKCSVHRFTLNGLAFTKSFGEYNAILWMIHHKIRGVLLEAAYRCYSYGGRFSVFTGNPVVIGWACHEVQWRGHAKMIERRMTDVLVFYKYPKYNWKILRKYNVSYVILGYEEKFEFHTSASKFKPLVDTGILKPIYNDKNVIIYKVIKS